MDTNIILALLSREEKQRRSVLMQWAKFRKESLILTMPVVSEVTNFLPRADQLSAFLDLSERMCFQFLPTDEVVPWQDVIRWLQRYAQHEPDFTDAFLVVLTSINSKFAVWTNDSEFWKKWRRPDGSPVPMAVK